MNNEQLTEKLKDFFAEDLCYMPQFEVLEYEIGIPYHDYKTATLRWRNRIEYWEIEVIAKHFDDNPWIEPIDEEYLSVIFTVNEKALK